jgi:hypothetical protein
MAASDIFCVSADWRWFLRPIPKALSRAFRPYIEMEYTSMATASAISVCTLRTWMKPVESVRQRGARILAEPREFAGARFAYVGALDGVIIELLEHRQWAAAPPATLAQRPALNLTFHLDHSAGADQLPKAFARYSERYSEP